MSWNDPATARWYESFCESHDRYRRANQALVDHAALEAGNRVLDVGAGTGRTTELVLDRLGETGRVVCLEPAAAMAELGQGRIQDPRVTWTDRWPEPDQRFDRVLCSAALWLLGPIEEALAALRARLVPGGALCFNVPALYLGEPDAPGGGTDPLLLSLWARLMEGRREGSSPPSNAMRLPDAHGLEACLSALDLEPVRWRIRVRLTQVALRDWLKIPPISEGVLRDVAPAARARRVDAAWASVDPNAWRWEDWLGWTAWAR